MRAFRHIWAAVGLSCSQLVAATPSEADGMSGFFGRLEEMVLGAREGRPLAGKATGIAKQAAEITQGYGSLVTFQESVKAGTASEKDIRKASSAAFESLKGFGGVVGALIIGPVERVGTNAAVLSHGSYATADALLSNDPAVRQAVSEEFERQRSSIPKQPKLDDPSWDIVSAGLDGLGRAALSAVQLIQSYSASPREGVGHKMESRGYPEVPASAAGIKPVCGTLEWQYQVGTGDCEPSADPPPEQSEVGSGWRLDGRDDCSAMPLNFKEFADDMIEDDQIFGCKVVKRTYGAARISFLFDCGSRMGGMAIEKVSESRIQAEAFFEPDEKLQYNYSQCQVRPETVANDCSPAGKAAWKRSHPQQVNYACGN